MNRLDPRGWAITLFWALVTVLVLLVVLPIWLGK